METVRRADDAGFPANRLAGRKVWVAGDRGMAGRAIACRLAGEPCTVIPNPPRSELDLRDQAAVGRFLESARPDLVFLAAARVGGIADNARHQADFIIENLQIETNVIAAAARLRVERLVFLGSSCIYPRDCPQPMREEHLLTGALEETNRAYAMAKLAGLELCNACRNQYGCDYLAVLPCNLYGPGDTYDSVRSHVIPALMLKIRDAIERDAPSIAVWGTGRALREFMHVDDMADACVHLAKVYAGPGPVNIGTGEEIGIGDLVAMLCEVAGYKGEVVFDSSMPEGTPRKRLDITRLSASSWSRSVPLRQGLERTWAEFLRHPRS